MNDPDKPPYTLIFEERANYLYARIEAASLTRRDALRYIREVADKTAELGCDRVLIERDIATVFARADTYFLAEKFTEMMRGIRVAWVNLHPAHDESIKFALLVGNNRGAISDVHPSIEEAEKWLMSGSGDLSAA